MTTPPNMQRMFAEVYRNLPEDEREEFRGAYKTQEDLLDALRRQTNLERANLRRFLKEHYDTLVPDEAVPDPTLPYMVRQILTSFPKEANKELYRDFHARQACVHGLKRQEAAGRFRLRTFLQERFDRLVAEAKAA